MGFCRKDTQNKRPPHILKERYAEGIFMALVVLDAGHGGGQLR